MTHKIERPTKAMTAIAAALAFTSTASLAQETAAPPDPVADTSVETTADPLAPAPSADAAPPPAPRPKVETSRTTSEPAKPSSRTATARSAVRRSGTGSATAPATTAAAPAAEALAPAPVAAEPVPPATALPAAPTALEPASPTTTPDAQIGDDMLPVAGAGALALLALGGAGLVALRRKRRRENDEFEARQEMLARLEAEPDHVDPVTKPQPTLELRPADEVRPGPVFARSRAPIHDPVPDKRADVTSNSATINWEARPDSDFLFRRDQTIAKDPVEPS
jgi:hypothetical protein